MSGTIWHDRLLAISGLLFLGLFACGLALADLLANAAFPPPSATLDDIASYFSQNGGAVRGLSVCHAFAALALMIFGAYLSHRVQCRQPSALGAIALASSGVAGAFLLLDAAIFWVLALPDVSRDPALLRALHGLSYLCGGVALALPLSALIGAVSLDALQSRSFPRWLAWIGIVTTIDCLAYGTTLVAANGYWSPSGLVLATVLPILWIFATSTVLLFERASFTAKLGGTVQTVDRRIDE
jgi:hypothetical protein